MELWEFVPLAVGWAETQSPTLSLSMQMPFLSCLPSAQSPPTFPSHVLSYNRVLTRSLMPNPRLNVQTGEP